MSAAFTTKSSDVPAFSSRTSERMYPSSSPRAGAPSVGTKQGSPPNLPSPYSNLTSSPVTRSTLANPDTLGHGSATARYAYLVFLPSKLRFTIPTSRFTFPVAGESTARRVDSPVRVLRRISVSTLSRRSSESLKMESAGVMQDPTTTTSPVTSSSHAFHKWKQKQSGTSTHTISDESPAYLGSTPNLDTFSLSSTTGEPPFSISPSLNTTWWSGTTTKFSVMAKSWIILDLDVVGLRPVGKEVEVLEVGPLDDVVAQREELAGDGVKLGVRDHGGPKLAVEIEPPHRLEIAVVGDADMVRKVIFRHGEEAAIKVHKSGVSNAGAGGGVDESDEPTRVEEGEPRDAGVAMELADGLGEDGFPHGALLLEAGGFREAAGVGLCAAVADADGVHHPVAVEQVVAGGGREAWVRAVAGVDSVDERRDPAGHRE
nr:unnamed protein product [Digitaria exilis]